MDAHRIYDLTVVHLFKCIFNLGPRAVNMLRAPRYLNPALSPSSFTYNSHIIKNKSFLAYFMRILNSCVDQQVSNCQPSVSAIPAAYLPCSTAIRRDIRAAWYFRSCELLCRDVECVFLITPLFQCAALYCIFAVVSCQARRQGGQWGQLPPPIPKVAPKIFRSIKLLMSKPKKYFSANHRKCLRNLLHNLVEPDQSTVVQQLSMIDKTLCSRRGNNRIFQVKPGIFVGWAKMVKFHFFHSKLSKQPFLLKI